MIWAQQQMIVWNVGQGQWVTWVEPQNCLHFDVGGEFFSQNQIIKNCKNKNNYIFLSHWDWDHINFINKFNTLNLKACLALAPESETTEYKRHFVKKISPCPDFNSNQVRKVNTSNTLQKKSNDFSHVLIHLPSRILIPGDSPAQQEKKWVLNLPTHIHGLILGHHGSQSSTSNLLLNRLKNLKWAVASARQKRYGHPHPKVISRLRQKKIPILKTEEWGNLIFQY